MFTGVEEWGKALTEDFLKEMSMGLHFEDE